MTEAHPRSEAEMRNLGAEWAMAWRAGDVVLLQGELGAGKTTLVRGVLEGLGFEGPVRSPTFNLIQTFDTTPPVMHADLYRLTHAAGLGLEDYLDTHLNLIEWPDRLGRLLDPKIAWLVTIEFEPGGRLVRVISPEIERNPPDESL